MQQALGCPTSHHPRIVPDAWEVQTSYQPFQQGEMIWSDHYGWHAQRLIFVNYARGTYQYFEDTYDAASDAAGGGETPPAGLLEPLLGFGKVWRTQPGVRDSLGWATAAEPPGEGRLEMFAHGNMLWISQTNKTYVYLRDGTLRVFDVPWSPSP